MKSWFRPAFSLLGLDIQVEGLKLLRFKKQGDRHDIHFIKTIPLPDKIFEGGKIKRWEIVQSLLSKGIAEEGLQDVKAAIALPGSIVKEGSFKSNFALSHDQVRAKIYAEISQELGMITDELSVDYEHHLGEIKFAAARSDYINQFITCIEAAGLRVKIVDIDQYALRRALDSFCPIFKTAPVLYRLGVKMLLIGSDFYYQWEVVNRQQFLNELKDVLERYTNKKR